MDCSNPFHVKVLTLMQSAKCMHSTRATETCKLVSVQNQNGGHTGSHMTGNGSDITVCKFQCYEYGEWKIRLAHQREGLLCDVFIE